MQLKVPRRDGFSNRLGWRQLWILIGILHSVQMVRAVHHMKREPLVYVNRRDDTRPLVVTNQCPYVIYPGLATQAGTPPESQGFPLASNQSRNLTVSADWQGRVWGRTNCQFGNQTHMNGGIACDTGDCDGMIDCQGTGMTPVTLAEFTLSSSSDQTFYDISVVDGYNLAMAIVSLYYESKNPSLADIPPNLTNPVCIGTASLLQAQGSTGDLILGTNASFPLPLDQSQSHDDVAQWCPWDLQLQPPQKPGSGVYPYPDSNIERPDFDPCYSACAKYNRPQDCCTGQYDSPTACSPNYYSTQAKAVCPDAYSYAFDDQSSTFIIPSGGGFEVVFCPSGRSTNILKTMGPQLRELSQSGVTPNLLADTMNSTLIQLQENEATHSLTLQSRTWLVVLVTVAVVLASQFGLP